MKKSAQSNAVSSSKDFASRIKKPALITGVIALALVAVIVAVVLVIPSQNETRARLNAEREQRLEELTRLNIEKDTMQELSALATSKDYLIRYLRRTHGYMFEGDIRIDLSDPNAVIPTPDPRFFPADDPND